MLRSLPVLFALILTGCVSTVDGRSRAAVPFVTDTVEGQYERPASEVFAVGDAGTILHFDGELWRPMPSPATQPLRAIWGASAPCRSSSMAGASPQLSCGTRVI